jgi:hypothetical protein
MKAVLMFVIKWAAIAALMLLPTVLVVATIIKLTR